MNDTNYDSIYSTSVYNRLMMELNNKQYYDDTQYWIYLEENGLDEGWTYNPNTMKKALFQTVYDILESLTSDIDLFRSIEKEFGTESEAYSLLQKKLDRLQKKIDSIPDNPQQGKKKSDISHLFYDYEE